MTALGGCVMETRERSVRTYARASHRRVRRPDPTSTIAAHAAAERPTTAEVKGRIEPDFMPWFASRSAIAAVRAWSETAHGPVTFSWSRGALRGCAAPFLDSDSA